MVSTSEEQAEAITDLLSLLGLSLDGLIIEDSKLPLRPIDQLLLFDPPPASEVVDSSQQGNSQLMLLFLINLAA